MHAEDGMAPLQMDTTWAVPGDGNRSPKRMPTPIDASTDTSVYISVLEGSHKTACVHQHTASISELCHAEGRLATLTPEEIWHQYFRPPLEDPGLLSESDFETRHFPSSATLDNFLAANRRSIYLSSDDFFLVDTAEFNSKQQACSTLANCSGWWRFFRIGYSEDGTEAIVHTDYDHPKYGLMGMGYFHLLALVDGCWSILARDMTWIF